MKVITQETFNEVVLENIQDFEMKPEEALKDAIEQFESQSVNLNNIIKEVVESNGKHRIENLLTSLKDSIENQSLNQDDIQNEVVPALIKEFKGDLSKRYQVCKHNAATAIVFNSCELSKNLNCLQAFSALVFGQPDELNTNHFEFIMRYLKETSEEEIIVTLLQILKSACIKHEANRQQLIKMNIIEQMLELAETNPDNSGIVVGSCSVIRCLTLDDDIRVTISKAHDHAKMIAAEHNGLERLTKILQDNTANAALVYETCTTLSKILVRSEFCQQLVDIGGFAHISTLINLHTQNKAIVKSCVVLLKTLAGNDEVKSIAVKNGAIEMLLKIVTSYIEEPQICKECFAALTMLSLWNPRHSSLIVEKKAAPLIVQCMKLHPDHAEVQKQACILVRCLVARTRQHSPIFIDLGVEALIRECRRKHNSVVEDESKAALRDLDLDAGLKEQWTGQMNKGLAL